MVFWSPDRTQEQGDTMRFMILLKADQDTEAGKMPSEQLLRDMGNFNQQLVDAGIMLAGVWIWQCNSRQQAIDWVKKVPMPMASGKATIEIRQIFEAEDFGAEFTPALREQEERMRAELERKSGV